MVYDGTLARATAACLAWAGLPLPGPRGETPRGEARPTAWRRRYRELYREVYNDG